MKRLLAQLLLLYSCTSWYVPVFAPANLWYLFCRYDIVYSLMLLFHRSPMLVFSSYQTVSLSVLSGKVPAFFHGWNLTEDSQNLEIRWCYFQAADGSIEGMIASSCKFQIWFCIKKACSSPDAAKFMLILLFDRSNVQFSITKLAKSHHFIDFSLFHILSIIYVRFSKKNRSRDKISSPPKKVHFEWFILGVSEKKWRWRAGKIDSEDFFAGRQTKCWKKRKEQVFDTVFIFLLYKWVIYTVFID